ncbi:hypothetical protein VTK56DRAFT_591 [Thermocarpiscus australiensis]
MVLLPALSASSPSSQPAVEQAFPGEEQATNYLVKTMELYDISNQISLSQLPPGSHVSGRLGLLPPSEFENQFGNVARFDASLDRWASNLPPHLQYGRLSRASDHISYRQAVSLQLRYLHARIALFRPMLARYCFSRNHTGAQQDGGTDTDRGGLTARLMEYCAGLCVENAQEMIALVDECRAGSDTNATTPAKTEPPAPSGTSPGGTGSCTCTSAVPCSWQLPSSPSSARPPCPSPGPAPWPACVLTSTWPRSSCRP